MEKNFKIANNGNLIVTISNSDNIFIPNNDINEDIGTYEQTTIQTIKKNKINVLKSFIENEKAVAEKQLNEMQKQLKPIKDLQDIDDKILKQCSDTINKGSKSFKISMKALVQRINDLNLKKKLIVQIEYVEKQLHIVKSDLDRLNKAIK